MFSSKQAARIGFSNNKKNFLIKVKGFFFFIQYAKCQINEICFSFLPFRIELFVYPTFSFWAKVQYSM